MVGEGKKLLKPVLSANYMQAMLYLSNAQSCLGSRHSYLYIASFAIRQAQKDTDIFLLEACIFTSLSSVVYKNTDCSSVYVPYLLDYTPPLLHREKEGGAFN